METKRDLSFEISTSVDLNKMLVGLIMDVRRGLVDPEKAKTISLIADKVNKNNVNAIEYKKVAKGSSPIAFFEESK